MIFSLNWWYFPTNLIYVLPFSGLFAWFREGRGRAEKDTEGAVMFKLNKWLYDYSLPSFILLHNLISVLKQ